MRPHCVEHTRDLFGPANIGLHHEAIGTALSDSFERVLRCCFVSVVMDAYVDTVFGKLQRDSSTNTTRASGDQGMFLIQ